MRPRPRTGSGDLKFSTKRRLRAWSAESPDDLAGGDALAAKLRYTGNPAHKRNPGDFGLTPPAAPRTHATLCDDAGIIDRATAIALLQKGARLGLVDDRTQEGGLPAIIWAFDEKERVFEARLENVERAEYHGYPLQKSDPIWRVILDNGRKREKALVAKNAARG